MPKSYSFRLILAFALCLTAALKQGRSTATLVEAPSVILEESFSSTDAFTKQDAVFHYTAGSFVVNNSAADNQNSSLNQLLCASFKPTDLAAGQTLKLSFRYQAGYDEKSNVEQIFVGIFSGKSVTQNGWDQYAKGSPMRDWAGYWASLPVGEKGDATVGKNLSADDDHPFFDGVMIGKSDAGKQVAGSWHACQFEISMQADERVVIKLASGEASDAMTAAFAEVVFAIDASPEKSVLSSLSNLAFFFTTKDKQNGRLVVDDVRLELIPAR